MSWESELRVKLRDSNLGLGLPYKRLHHCDSAFLRNVGSTFGSLVQNVRDLMSLTDFFSSQLWWSQKAPDAPNITSHIITFKYRKRRRVSWNSGLSCWLAHSHPTRESLVKIPITCTFRPLFFVCVPGRKQMLVQMFGFWSPMWGTQIDSWSLVLAWTNPGYYRHLVVNQKMEDISSLLISPTLLLYVSAFQAHRKKGEKKKKQRK